jgi:3-oxoacyl-[acyl-carrier protein] reductase
MAQLENKVTVVTGAGRGIGRAIALKFASEGSDVVCISRSAENAAKVAHEIESSGRRSWGLGVDVSDGAAVSKAAETILKETGHVDILVNNAGITRDGFIMRMSEADWDAVMQTNLKGAFLFLKAFSRNFLKQRSGRIINIGSIVGSIGNAGQSNYAASKAGLVGFTKSAARELASRGINVNAIAPGFIETDLTSILTEEVKKELLQKIPLNSFGQVEDIAAAALFLAGPAGRYITGHVLTVDGGMAM